MTDKGREKKLDLRKIRRRNGMKTAGKKKENYGRVEVY
jgi:hypothetical protein